MVKQDIAELGIDPIINPVETKEGRGKVSSASS